MPTFTDLLPKRVADRINSAGDPIGDCWHWAGGHDKDGYGKVRVGGVDWRLHRFVWTRLRGPIPDGLEIDHLCRVRGCCNPEHMEVVDSRTNTLRGENRAAQNARKTHCPKGHPLVPALDQRVCPTCRRADWRRYNETHRAERAAAQAVRNQRRRKP